MSAPGRSPGLTALTATVLLAGCAGLPPPREVGQPVSRQAAEALVAALERREVAVRSLRGIAAVEVTLNGETRRFREAVAVRSDGRFRLETLGALGLPVLVIASDGDRVAVSGSPEAPQIAANGCEFVSRLFGFALPPAALARLLSGLSPLPVAAAAVLFLPERQAYLLEREEGNALQRLYLDSSGALTAGEIWDGRQGLHFAFGEVHAITGIDFPLRVVLRQARRQVSVTVQYQAIDLNPILADHLFVLPSSLATKAGDC